MFIAFIRVGNVLILGFGHVAVECTVRMPCRRSEMGHHSIL